jgi:uncharacterized membrane protein YbhN (UPF0104 family)
VTHEATLDVADEGVEKRSRATLLLRIALSAGMLALLVTKVPDFRWQRVFPDPDLGTAAWLVGAAVLTLGALGLATLRWQTVLRALGLEQRYQSLLSHYMAGQFVSNVLPTTIGGDVLRVTRASRDNGNSPVTFASVVIERLTGWLVLPAITLLGLAINPGLRELERATTVAFGIAAVTLVGLLLILVAADHPSVGGRFADREGWQRFAGAVHLGVGQLRRRPSAAASVLGVGFAYQYTLVVAAFMAARAMGIDQARITTLMVFLPAVLVLQVLPISIAGFGVREGALILFFSHSPLGVPQEQAIGLGLLLYILNVAVSALGAPALAMGGGPRGPSVA